MPIEVMGIDPRPIARIPFAMAAVGGGAVERFLEVRVSDAVGLPLGIDGVLVAGDLQGRGRPVSGSEAPRRLLGEALAEWLGEFIEGDGGLERKRVGVVLGGDLFARPGSDRRGGSGDVRAVWRAFANQSAWVAGVAGNHDRFGPGWPEADFRAFGEQRGVHVLDGDVVELSGVRIAGLSGVVGNPRRPFRRAREVFEAEVARLAGMTRMCWCCMRAPTWMVWHCGGMLAYGWSSSGRAPCWWCVGTCSDLGRSRSCQMALRF